MWPLRIWHFTLVLNSTSFWNSENIYEHSNPINKGFVHVYNVRTEQRFVFKVFKTKDYITNLEVFHCVKKYGVKLGKCRQLVTMEIHLNTKPLFGFSVEIPTSIALVASWELLNIDILIFCLTYFTINNIDKRRAFIPFSTLWQHFSTHILHVQF